MLADCPTGHHRVFRFANASFDEASQELLVAGERRNLEAKPRALLLALLAQPKMVVSKRELVEAAWPEKRFVEEGSLATAIYNLRAALGPDGHTIIQTVTGTGYKLAVAVEADFAEAAPSPPLLLQAGERVPGRAQWRLERPLGAPNARAVWLARHDKTGEPRVFKFAATPESLDGLKREAALSRLLQSRLGVRDDIVRIAEWNFEDRPYFIESPFGGPDLPAWLQSLGGLAALSLADRVALVARTVADAHDAGVLHGDIKPANILVAEAPDGTGRPRLVDFGAGGLTEAARTEVLSVTLQALAEPGAGSRTGTFLYMAPEVLAGGQHTAAADVCALGILLYQVVAGDLDRPLAAGWERDVADAVLRQDIADAAAGDRELRLASARLLAQRLETLEARRAEAAAVAEQRRVQALREAEREQLIRTAELRRLEAAAAADRAAHAVQLARRTRLAAIALLALFVAASAMAIYARREQQVAAAQRDRANQITGIAQDTVGGLLGDIAKGVQLRSVLTNADLLKLLDRAEATIVRMTSLAPDAPQLRRLEAFALDKFADISLHQGDLMRALDSAERAASLQQTLLATDAGNATLRRELAESERWIGDVRLRQHDAQRAIAAYQLMRDIDKQLATDDQANPNLQLGLARADEAVGDALLQRHDVKAALLQYQLASAIITAGLAAHGADPVWQLDLSTIEEKTGDVLEALGDWRGALAAYRSDLRLRQRLYDSDRTNMRWQRDLAVSYADVGDEQKALHDYIGALASYKAALALDEQRISFDPSQAQWQSDAANSNANIAETLVLSGAGADAVAFFQTALAILEPVSRKDPSNAEYGTNLLEVEVGLGDDLASLGRTSEAAVQSAHATQLAHRLVSEHPDDAEIKLRAKTAEALARRLGGSLTSSR